MTWMEKKYAPVYEWRNSLSFIMLENWIRESAQESFMKSIQSQLSCESNIISSSLSSLVCDCLAPDSPKNASCYEEAPIAISVGISGACKGEMSFIKGPSSYIRFEESSTLELCTTVTLDLIYKSWFDEPTSQPRVSFQFATETLPGAVRNTKGAEVGKVLFFSFCWAIHISDVSIVQIVNITII